MEKNIFTRARRLARKTFSRAPKDLSVLVIAFAVIFCAFAIRDIQDYQNMPPLAEGVNDVYGFYGEDNLLPAVKRFRKDNGKPVEGYAIPSSSMIGMRLQKVGVVNDEQAFASASGLLTLNWDEQSIQDYENLRNPLEQRARDNLMSALSINFSSEEERSLRFLWRNSRINDKGVKTFREKYFFKGNFKLDHDFRKFPFDVSTLNIRISTPIQAPDIMLQSDLDDIGNDDPEWRINSYVYDKQDCNYPKDWKLDKDLYEPQWLCANDVFEYVHDDKALADFKDRKAVEPSKVDSLLSLNPQVVYTTKFRRAPGSSFYRYIAPIAFVLLVASIFDQLSDDAWEVKIAIPPTILLTLIFMHSSFRAEIPQISYITFMDRIYFIAYASCVLLLLSTIVSRRERLKKIRDQSNEGDLPERSMLRIGPSPRLVIAIRGMFILLVTVAPFVAYYFS